MIPPVPLSKSRLETFPRLFQIRLIKNWFLGDFLKPVQTWHFRVPDEKENPNDDQAGNQATSTAQYAEYPDELIAGTWPGRLKLGSI